MNRQIRSCSFSSSGLAHSVRKSVRLNAVVRRRRLAELSARSQAQEGNFLVKGGVAAVTAILNTLRSGATGEEREESEAPGGVADVERRLKADYLENQYFVTGDVDLGLYTADCLFADPTISFRGRRRYVNNLQTLKAFFLDPKIELFSLEQLDHGHMLQADWRLTVQLRLPWKPEIDVLGSTIYTLSPKTFQIEEHREKWDVSAFEAILQVFGKSRTS